MAAISSALAQDDNAPPSRLKLQDVDKLRKIIEEQEEQLRKQQRLNEQLEQLKQQLEKQQQQQHQNMIYKYEELICPISQEII